MRSEQVPIGSFRCLLQEVLKTKLSVRRHFRLPNKYHPPTSPARGSRSGGAPETLIKLLAQTLFLTPTCHCSHATFCGVVSWSYM